MLNRGAQRREFALRQNRRLDRVAAVSERSEICAVSVEKTTSGRCFSCIVLLLMSAALASVSFRPPDLEGAGRRLAPPLDGASFAERLLANHLEGLQSAERLLTHLLHRGDFTAAAPYDRCLSFLQSCLFPWSRNREPAFGSVCLLSMHLHEEHFCLRL